MDPPTALPGEDSRASAVPTRDFPAARQGRTYVPLRGHTSCSPANWTSAATVPRRPAGEVLTQGAPATHHPRGSVRGHGSEVTRRRGASVRIPIRALHRPAYARPRNVCEEGGPGLAARTTGGALRELPVIVASAGPPRRKRSFSQRPGAWSEPRESGAGTPQPTAEPRRPTRETPPPAGTRFPRTRRRSTPAPRSRRPDP